MSLDDEPTGEAGPGTGSPARRPTCTNCGERPAPAAHTLRFEREERSDRVVDLQLCGPCLETITDEPGVHPE